MLKLKTKKGVKKRFKLTKKGKLKRYRPGRRHLLSAKSSGRKRHLRRGAIVEGMQEKLTKKLLPYG